MFAEADLLHMARGVRLFNAGKFWECHEELEDLWIADVSPVRYIYWSVIQVAVGLYHYEGSNLVGAIDMLYKAKEKMHNVQSSHIESEILYKFLSWKKFKGILLTMQEGKEEETLITFTNFRFPNPDKWGHHFE